MRRSRPSRPRPAAATVHVLTGVAALPVRVAFDEETDEPFLELLLLQGKNPSFITAYGGDCSSAAACKLLSTKTGLSAQPLAHLPPVNLITQDGGSPVICSLYLLDAGDEEPKTGAEWFEYRTAHHLLSTREEKNAAWTVVHVLLEAVRHRILRQSSWKRWADDILECDETQEDEHEHAAANNKPNNNNNTMSLDDAARIQEALKAVVPGQRVLPATLLSGFLGAGKTTLLKHVLNNRQGLKVAVIVNDVSEVLAVSDVDSMKRGDTALSKVTDKMVEMPNGYLLLEIARLAQEGRFEYLLIESTGVSEPMQVAETWAFKLPDGRAVSDFARIDTCVTVIDSRHFLKDFTTKEQLKDRKWEAQEGDERTISHLLTDQVEFADVIVLNKIDLITEAQLSELKAAIAVLNPDAKILESKHSAVPLTEILNTNKFSMEKAATHSGWMKSIGGEPPSEAAEYGITSFVYRASLPFHPKRLHDLVYGANIHELKDVIRSKGFIWLATRMQHLAVWGHAGTLYTIDKGRAWYATIPPDEWNLDEDESKALLNRMQSRWGDRCQELVLIGRKMNHDAVKAALDRCLLTKDEMTMGVDAWKSFDDPFPSWDDHDGHDHGDEDEGGDSADEYIM